MPLVVVKVGVLLYEIRNVLFQFDYDKETIKRLTPEMIRVLRKNILPDLDKDVPFGHQADLYFALGQVQQTMPDVAIQHILAADIVLQYLNERFQVLEGKEVDGIKLQDLKKTGEGLERFVNMFAYMVLTNSYMDTAMKWFKTCASVDPETPEEQKKRMKQNSSK